MRALAVRLLLVALAGVAFAASPATTSAFGPSVRTGLDLASATPAGTTPGSVPGASLNARATSAVPRGCPAATLEQRAPVPLASEVQASAPNTTPGRGCAGPVRQGEAGVQRTVDRERLMTATSRSPPAATAWSV